MSHTWRSDVNIYTQVQYGLLLAVGYMFIRGNHIYLCARAFPRCMQHLYTHLCIFHVHTQQILEEQKD